ncbi:hypothetical protein GDO81_001919 [Engystomops pustulosus]|uniref:Uncharacterized protein n=1 Tax=Engystomops pustulosus TaxID=76066 RepID=A0AAV7DH00_ENGPU|nr:hypothetical protein GDO81_001919 [Engystomops pustulosus]
MTSHPVSSFPVDVITRVGRSRHHVTFVTDALRVSLASRSCGQSRRDVASSCGRGKDRGPIEAEATWGKGKIPAPSCSPLTVPTTGDEERLLSTPCPV